MEKFQYSFEKYQNNMDFAEEELFRVTKKDVIVTAKKGKTTLTYYLDGKKVSINVIINQKNLTLIRRKVMKKVIYKQNKKVYNNVNYFEVEEYIRYL